MTCPICGLSEHPVTGCITALRAELRRKDLLIADLYDACKAVLEEFDGSSNYTFAADWRHWWRAFGPIRNRLRLAAAAEEEQ